MTPSHPLGPVLRTASVAAAVATFYGCAGTSALPTQADAPQDSPAAPTVLLPLEPTAYEMRQRERALALARQGKLADAALIWELLATIRPRVDEYRERGAEVQRQIAGGVADRLRRGEQAASRGQLDSATQQYLAALALQPDNTKAADALRGVERERNKRNHLGKLSRNTLTRRAMADADMVATADDDPSTESLVAPASKTSGSVAGTELDHAAQLAGQSEWDAAIGILEPRVRSNPRDDAARVLLADIYYRKAETFGARYRTTAIGWLERSVRTDPSHPRAADRLKQLRLVAAAANKAATPVAVAAAASSSARSAAPATSPVTSPTNGLVVNTAVKPAMATLVSPAASSAQPPVRR